MTRVLVVEDEESFSDALSYMLRREGFEAVVAGSGPDALAEFDRGGADIVLLDLMLPGLPGTEVCRALRSRSNVPIIMLTAKDGEIDKVVGLELGADDYVTKPYSARELVARIRAVLRRSQGDDGTGSIEIGGLRIDAPAQRVYAGDELVSIGPTEYRLLHFFMTHAERVYSRAQLLDHVWGGNVYVEERTVDVHVRRLRKTLEPYGLDRLLQTVRGTGYRLSVKA
jgi:two-component system phosphate regulon response regulator PhoB